MQILRFTLLIFILVCMYWSSIVLKVNFLGFPNEFTMSEYLSDFKGVLIGTVSVSFWIFFVVEVIDLFYSATGRNGKLFRKFFASVKTDLIIFSATSAIMISIYIIDGKAYDLIGIDMGASGIPFIVMAFLSLIGVRKQRIAGQKLNALPFYVVFGLMAIFCFFVLKILSENSSGDFAPHEAIWLQLTILFGSFCCYMTSNYISFFILNGKVAVSKFKMDFFSKVPTASNIFNQELIENIEKANKEMVKSKARYRAQKMRKRKSSN